MAQPNYPLSIKVMRLYAPAIGKTAPPVASHLGSGSPEAHPTPFSPEMIMLPEGFGALHAGQRFGGYVTVLNHSERTIYNVKISAELQLEGAKKVALEDKRGPSTPSGVTLNPGDLADMVLECPLGPSGAYTLKVTVNHADPGTTTSGTTKDIQKYYRFAITDPFGFNYRPVFVKKTATSGEFELFVEVEVSNTTAVPVCVAALQLEPPPNYVASAVNLASLESDAGGEDDWMFKSKEAALVIDPLDVDGVTRARPVLQPAESYHAVFRILPVTGGDSRGWPSGTALEIGRISVFYRMQLTEHGHWLSQPLIARTPSSPNLTLSWLDVPPSMTVDTMVSVRQAAVVCRIAVVSSLSSPQARLVIRNTSAIVHPKIRLVYTPSVTSTAESGVVVQGISSQLVGPIPSLGIITVPLKLLAVKPGLHGLDVFSVFSETDPSLKLLDDVAAKTNATVVVVK